MRIYGLPIPDSDIPDVVVRPQVERDGRWVDAPASWFKRCDEANWQLYAELFYRLTHWSLAKLKQAGHWIPDWREALR